MVSPSEKVGSVSWWFSFAGTATGCPRKILKRMKFVRNADKIIFIEKLVYFDFSGSVTKRKSMKLSNHQEICSIDMINSLVTWFLKIYKWSKLLLSYLIKKWQKSSMILLKSRFRSLTKRMIMDVLLAKYLNFFNLRKWTSLSSLFKLKQQRLKHRYLFCLWIDSIMLILLCCFFGFWYCWSCVTVHF